MRQICFKFKFDVLKNFRTWWNLACRTLITSSGLQTLQPRDLWFANQDSWIDLEIEFEII
jgi:hypothetical protein